MVIAIVALSTSIATAGDAHRKSEPVKWLLTVDSSSQGEAFFKSVTGLDFSAEAQPLREGGVNPSRKQVRATVTLHTGPLTRPLQAWLNSRQRRNVTLTALDAEGDAIARYTLVNAAIENLKRASLSNPKSPNEPQLEEMTIVCERIEKIK